MIAGDTLLPSLGLLDEGSVLEKIFALRREGLGTDDAIDSGTLNAVMSAACRIWAGPRKASGTNAGQEHDLVNLTHEALEREGVTVEGAATRLGTADIQHATATLHTMGLLRREQRTEDPLDLPRTFFQPGWLGFWANKVAKGLTPGPLMLGEATERWRTEPRTRFGEAVLYSAANRLARGDNAVTHLSSMWEQDEAWRSAVLLAAPSCSSQVQSEVGKQLRSTQWGTHEARTVFALLRFLALSHDHGLDRVQATGLLKPHYELIGRLGLSDYLLFVLEALADRRPVGNRVEPRKAFLMALSGIEKAGVAESASEIAYDVLLVELGLERSKDVNKAVESFIMEVDREAKAALVGGTSDSGGGTQNIKPRDTFWANLLMRHASEVLDEKGFDAWTWFVEHDWYREPPKLGMGFASGLATQEPHIRLRWRSSANLALGAWYRTKANSGEREQYEEIVELLASPSGHPHVDRAAEVGFYLIRHSVPTETSQARPVSTNFLPALRELKKRVHGKTLELLEKTLELTERRSDSQR